MKYRNKKNLRYATLVEENTKFNTVTMQYEDDGSTTSITTATLKRWWKKVVEETPVEENNVEEVQEDVAGDGTPLAEVGKEIVAQAKEKSKKAKKEKVKKGKDISKYVQEIISVCEELKYSVKIYESEPRMINIINTEGKFLCVAYTGNNKVAVSMREASFPEGFVVSRIRKCPLSHAIDISYEDNFKDVFKKLLSKIKYVPTIKSKKEEKKNG